MLSILGISEFMDFPDVFHVMEMSIIMEIVIKSIQFPHYGI